MDTRNKFTIIEPGLTTISGGIITTPIKHPTEPKEPKEPKEPIKPTEPTEPSTEEPTEILKDVKETKYINNLNAIQPGSQKTADSRNYFCRMIFGKDSGVDNQINWLRLGLV